MCCGPVSVSLSLGETHLTKVATNAVKCALLFRCKLRTFELSTIHWYEKRTRSATFIRTGSLFIVFVGMSFFWTTDLVKFVLISKKNRFSNLQRWRVTSIGILGSRYPHRPVAADFHKSERFVYAPWENERPSKAFTQIRRLKSGALLDAQLCKLEGRANPFLWVLVDYCLESLSIVWQTLNIWPCHVV